MSHRNPLSGLKKKLKRRLAGGRDDPERIGTDSDRDQDVASTGSLPQTEPHVVVKDGHDCSQLGNEGDVDKGRADSTDPPPHSESDGPGPVPVSERGHDRGEKAAVEGGEVSGSELCLSLGVGGVAESRPSREGSVQVIDGKKCGRIDPPKSTPLIPKSRGSEGMPTAHCFSRCP